MNTNIKHIFEQNIQLLGDADKSVYYFRQQQYNKALGIVTNSLDKIEAVVEAIITDREYFHTLPTDHVLDMLSGLLEAKKNKDYILFADILELQLISFLYRVQELILRKENISFNEDRYRENVHILLERGIGFSERLMMSIDARSLLDSGYRIESTSCGLMTLAAENENATFYFHTNNRVQLEAFLLAEHWVQRTKQRYILYGYGMGYHIKELLRLAPKAEIEVFEGDINILQLACAFTDLQEFAGEERLRIFFDPDFKALKKRITSLTAKEAFIIHYPSLMNIREAKIRSLLEEHIPWSKMLETC
ncbi:MAG: motility associated factor glycosyltransferase family protein [Lachnospiraceae bacterium]|nr:motility associated factor glycosyltransferase family protein [Lachnospiraceae bacterium]